MLQLHFSKHYRYTCESDIRTMLKKMPLKVKYMAISFIAGMQQ